MTWPTKKHLQETIAKQEAAFKKQVDANRVLTTTLTNIRAESADCINKKQGHCLNNVWLIQTITESLTRAEEVAKK